LKGLNMKLLFILLTLIVISCSSNDNVSDAYGNFEADEVIISAESTGKISDLHIKEGDEVKSGEILAQIDTTQLYLQKLQILASMEAVASKTQNIKVQVDVLNEKKKNLLREKQRLENLLKDGAATQKQIDDINGELEVVERSITATKTGMQTTNKGLLSELKPLKAQLELIEDRLLKCMIKSPIDGTVLIKYVENGEFAAAGKPIFKVSNIDDIYLRAYVSGSQLAEVVIGRDVKVLIDKNEDEFHEYKGKITWISSKSEFTPKIIQTKEERVNMVYAIKVLVENDGKIKIGMPGELKF